jgi:anti-sigma B factor antagonist
MRRPRGAILTLSHPDHRPTRIDSGTLTIEVGPEVETCLVKLAGELDLATVPPLRTEVHRLMSDGLRRVVVDLADLEFIDSMGIQCLIELSSRSAAEGDTLRIVDPRGDVDRMFRLTGVREVLPLIDTPRAGVS